MKKAEKKQWLLNYITSRNDWVKAPEILVEADIQLKERTLRRLLSDLKHEQLIEITGKGRSTRYRAIAINSEFIVKSELAPNFLLGAEIGHPIFGSKAAMCIAAIRKPIYERNPVTYSKAWLESYQPNKTFYFSENQLDSMEIQGQRGRTKKIEPAGTYSKKILNRLLIDLSYNSSRLEGNTYSLIDTEKLLIDGVRPTDKLDEERVMILNHKDAIEYLVRNAANFNVSINEICTLHYLLSDGLLRPEYTGKIRNEGVRIGFSTYSPLEDNARLTSYLELLTLKASQINNPYEQSLFLLIHIAYLQPFLDVNKRTARLSANIPLIKQNKVPLSFNELNKDDYISAMIAVYELNDVTAITDLYYFSYLRTCKSYDATIESVGFDPIRVKYRQQRRKLVSTIIRDKLLGDALQSYVSKVSKLEVIDKEQQEFINSVEDDLKQLNPASLAGLGISQTEFIQWKKMCEM